MLKRIILLSIVLVVVIANLVSASSPPKIEAEAAVLMKADDLQVLFDKKANDIMYPASTTKIVTLITAIEEGNLNSVVVASPQAALCDGSSLELKAGDKLTLQEALYGMMLVSGNDAAEVIAENVAGSVPQFVQKMNDKAEAIGATRTHFTNPHGLPDPINHFTTAYDLALITSYGMSNPLFAQIVASREHDVRFTSGAVSHVTNTNKLLKTYKGANGVKTGFTNAAGECLVASATRKNVQLVAVILNSDYRWSDAAKLLDYGFQQLGL
ncbi:D-alanyl-D-alanine carboxypeptidase family protein [Dendrosporobacter sp. 1207_IL3150]|uniref:D-alanyl-D-alanine carboxypeptidase family protein n=1 Tax=Dendrosporobacter sp. 1207_IL3150 TaxID=3084054 RepID=UPI002FD92F50